MHISFIFRGVTVHLIRTIFRRQWVQNELHKKISSTVIPKDMNVVVIFVISITCLCIVRKLSNFMVVKVVINVSMRYLSIVWEHSSTDFTNSFAFSDFGRAKLMLLAILPRINIKQSLFVMRLLFIATSTNGSSRLFNLKSQIKIQYT